MRNCSLFTNHSALKQLYSSLVRPKPEYYSLNSSTNYNEYKLKTQKAFHEGFRLTFYPHGGYDNYENFLIEARISWRKAGHHQAMKGAMEGESSAQLGFYRRTGQNSDLKRKTENNKHFMIGTNDRFQQRRSPNRRHPTKNNPSNIHNSHQ